MASIRRGFSIPLNNPHPQADFPSAYIKYPAFVPSSVEVLFCSVDMTADAYIERTVGALSHPDRVLVVTSDRAERETVMGGGGA